MEENSRFINKRRINPENKGAFLNTNKETTPVKRLKVCDIHTDTPVVPGIQSRIKALTERNNTPESPSVEKYSTKVANKINKEKVEFFESQNKTCNSHNNRVETLFQKTKKENNTLVSSNPTSTHKSILRFCNNNNEQNSNENKENLTKRTSANLPSSSVQPTNDQKTSTTISNTCFKNNNATPHSNDVCGMEFNAYNHIDNNTYKASSKTDNKITDNNLSINHLNDSSVVYDRNNNLTTRNNEDKNTLINNNNENKNTQISNNNEKSIINNNNNIINNNTNINVVSNTNDITNDLEVFNQGYHSFSADDSCDITPDKHYQTASTIADGVDVVKNSTAMTSIAGAITALPAGVGVNEDVGRVEIARLQYDDDDDSSPGMNDGGGDDDGKVYSESHGDDKGDDGSDDDKGDDGSDDDEGDGGSDDEVNDGCSEDYDGDNDNDGGSNDEKNYSTFIIRKDNNDDVIKKCDNNAKNPEVICCEERDVILRNGTKAHEGRRVTDEDQIKRFSGRQAQEEVVLRQAKNALKTFHENNSNHSTLHSNKTYVDCHRIILVSRLKIDFYEKELKKVRASMGGNKNPSESDSTNSTSATFSISQLEIPLHADLIKSMSERDEESHHFVVVLSCGQQIFFSPLITAVKGDESLTLNGPFEFENIQAASTFKFEVYTMSSNTDSNEKSKKRSSLVDVLATPIRKLLPSSTSDRLSKNFQFQPLHCKFLILALCEVVVTTSFLSRVQLAFDQVPQVLRKLAGQVHLDCNLNIRSLLQHKHFLTMFEDVNGLGVWQRRWCSLVGTKIFYWKYPEDEEDKPASGHIDLINCQYELAKMVTWEVCARPNTLQLVAWFEASTNRKSSLITTVSDNEIKTKYWLSADTKEGCLKWCDVINHVIKDIRRWGGRRDEEE